MIAWLRTALAVLVLAGPAISADPSRDLDEGALKQRYEQALEQLDEHLLVEGYPRLLRDLDSDDPLVRQAAIRMLGAMERLEAIPWLLSQIEHGDIKLRVEAGHAIEQTLSRLALRRRDPSAPGPVVLRPRAPGEPDLHAYAWVALVLLRLPDDGSTHAYAASIVRYTEAVELEGELRKTLRSPHPAVSDQARWALDALGLGGDRASGISVDVGN